MNATSLIHEMKHTDNLGFDALGYCNSSRHILLYYEDLVNNRTVSSLLHYLINTSLIAFQTKLNHNRVWFLQKLLDVLEFLKLPKHKLHSHHVKIHKKALSDQIENWDVVYNTLKGTQYETFLNADYTL